MKMNDQPNFPIISRKSCIAGFEGAVRGKKILDLDPLKSKRPYFEWTVHAKTTG